ncbi:MAG: hypothetical protein IPK59_02690 [Rhodospirillaceae bacterium]|nr:hypothetical protein [Rhodospirillaceae bacterium]
MINLAFAVAMEGLVSRAIANGQEIKPKSQDVDPRVAPFWWFLPFAIPRL